MSRQSKARMGITKPPWQLAVHATIVDAEEITYVFERVTNRNPIGSAVGYVVQVFTGTGEAWGWVAHIYTDHLRRNQGTRQVGQREVGRHAKRRCAAAVWKARAIEPIYPEAGVTQRTYGYGCGRDSRAYRGAVR